MKIHHIITLAVMFAFTILRAEGGLLPAEDALAKGYWQSLDPKSKIVFLTAYRHTRGPAHDKTAKPEFFVLSAKHFPTLVTKLDEFYKNLDNEHVSVKDAIRICFMEMSGKPQTDIDKAIKEARDAFLRY
jgi:hypothetical protein